MEEQLKKLIQEAVAEALSTFMPQATQTVPEIMNSTQLAEYLQVSEAWVRKNAKRIPRLNVVGTRFRKSDIDAWLSDNVVGANESVIGRVSKGTVKSKNSNVYRVI